MEQIAVGTYNVALPCTASATLTVNVGFYPKVVVAWGDHSETQKTKHPLYNDMTVDGTAYTST